jgi:predicted metalloprotease with PDZ domain
MRFRISTFVALLIAAGTLVLAQERRCSAPAKECAMEIRKMMSARRFLGAKVVELNPGLIIKSVIENSPAARGGLMANDRLIAMNGKSLTLATSREFKQMLADGNSTGKLWIIVHRSGAYKKIDVRLEPYPKDQIEKAIALHLLQSHPTSSAGAQ